MTFAHNFLNETESNKNRFRFNEIIRLFFLALFRYSGCCLAKSIKPTEFLYEPFVAMAFHRYQNKCTTQVSPKLVPFRDLQFIFHITI